MNNQAIVHALSRLLSCFSSLISLILEFRHGIRNSCCSRPVLPVRPSFCGRPARGLAGGHFHSSHVIPRRRYQSVVHVPTALTSTTAQRERYCSLPPQQPAHSFRPFALGRYLFAAPRLDPKNSTHSCSNFFEPGGSLDRFHANLGCICVPLLPFYQKLSNSERGILSLGSELNQSNQIRL